MDRYRFFSFRYAPHRSWKALAALPALGLLLALAGPFGSYLNMPFFERCAHFVVCFTAIGFLIMEGAYRLARRFFMGNWPVWVALIFDLALAAPTAGIVWTSLYVFAPAAIGHIEFLDLVWQNLLIILAVQAGVIAGAILKNPGVLNKTSPATVRDTYPLAHRLPFALKRVPILALSSEDHYLRIYTERGEALIHMTLADGIDALAGGFQIHRSHWIHDEAVTDYKNGMVELSTGLRLPLSRHRKKEFETWLTQRACSFEKD